MKMITRNNILRNQQKFYFSQKAMDEEINKVKRVLKLKFR
jgi:hypothetical protein